MLSVCRLLSRAIKVNSRGCDLLRLSCTKITLAARGALDHLRKFLGKVQNVPLLECFLPKREDADFAIKIVSAALRKEQVEPDQTTPDVFAKPAQT